MTLITGDAADNDLVGTTDDDTIFGLAGNDSLYGNGGNDLLDGGEGNDLIEDDGRDTLYGADGDDTLYAGRDWAFAYGGAGNDVIDMDGGYFAGVGSISRAYGGAGDDLVLFHAPAGGRAYGGSGTDMLAISISGNFGTATGGVIDFSTGSGVLTGPGALSLTFDGFERLHYQGNNGVDSVIGGASDDLAYLYGGANFADMGAGNDTVAARHGAEQTLIGGDGQDVLILMDGLFPVYFVITGFDGNVDDGNLSQISGFERYEVLGSIGAGNDYISLGSGDDTGRGLGGNDTVYGMEGDDLLQGGGGIDSLLGGDGHDTLAGGSGNDVLYCDSGNDHLVLNMDSDLGYGGAGNDRLVFQGGSHTAWGGLGRDTFVFRKPDGGLDWLGDFTSGEDRLRFEAAELQAAPGPGGTVTLSYGAVTGTAAQFLFYLVGSQGHLLWDPDGVGAQDAVLLAITLNGETVMARDLGVVL